MRSAWTKNTWPHSKALRPLRGRIALYALYAKSFCVLAMPSRLARILRDFVESEQLGVEQGNTLARAGVGNQRLHVAEVRGVKLAEPAQVVARNRHHVVPEAARDPGLQARERNA